MLAVATPLLIAYWALYAGWAAGLVWRWTITEAMAVAVPPVLALAGGALLIVLAGCRQVIRRPVWVGEGAVDWYATAAGLVLGPLAVVAAAWIARLLTGLT